MLAMCDCFSTIVDYLVILCEHCVPNDTLGESGDGIDSFHKIDYKILLKRGKIFKALNQKEFLFPKMNMLVSWNCKPYSFLRHNMLCGMEVLSRVKYISTKLEKCNK